MACLDRLRQRTETTFVTALRRVDRFQVRRNSLELYDRNRLVMRFVAPTKLPPVDPFPSIGLEDKKWKLESIKGRSVGPNGRGAFLVFDKRAGSAGGNSSCNVFGGEYTQTDSRLVITDIVATMRACIEDDRMNIERQFLDSLRITNRYEIQGTRLKLYRNKEELLTFVGEKK
jgi:heat shock protein HslJ